MYKTTIQPLLKRRKQKEYSCHTVEAHSCLLNMNMTVDLEEIEEMMPSKVQYWQLIDIPRPISSYCFYKDICPSPKLYPNLLQLPILHLYGSLYTAVLVSPVQSSP